MARADFYVLAEDFLEARDAFLARLLEKVVTLGRRVHVHAQDETEARRLDRLLWTFRPDSFLPHSLMAAGLEEAPIELAWGQDRPRHRDVWLNLALDLPSTALECDRLGSIVIQQPEILAASRKHYRRCQEAGFVMHLHDMRPAPGEA